MARQIKAKIKEYTNAQGETKGEWVDLGVILSNSNGDYIMLNPTVDLAGVLMRQRLLAQAKGSKVGDNVMCSIFDSSQQQAPQQPQQATQQPMGDGGFNDSSDVPF